MSRTVIERNLRYLVLELFWAAIHVSCVSFNAAFLIRMGGTNVQVGLLSAGPALMIALSTVPFAMLMERTARRKRWLVGSLLVSRLTYGLLILVPFLPGAHPPSIVGIVLGVSITNALFSAGWLPLLGEIVPIERRARLFAARNLVLGITVTCTTFVLGRWLEVTPFPTNYQVLYVISFVASIISTWYVARLVIPEGDAPTQARSDSQAPAGIQSQRPFINILVNTLIFTVPTWMAIPLQPIYFVRELGASEGWLGLWTGLVSGGAILGNLLWQRLIDRKGPNWVLVRATLLSTLYFLMIGVFPDLTLILVFGLLSGLITPGVELSHINTLYRVCPENRRATYMGVYIALMNVGAFLSPLVVAPLIETTGARVVVLVMFAIRLVGAVMFSMNPVRLPPSEMAVAAGR